MAKEKEHVVIFGGAVCHTIGFGITVLLTLLMLIGNEEFTVLHKIALIVMIVIFLVSSIYLWIRGTKKYIDFAIEEKVSQKRESASSPNENESDA